MIRRGLRPGRAGPDRRMLRSAARTRASMSITSVVTSWALRLCCSTLPRSPNASIASSKLASAPARQRRVAVRPRRVAAGLLVGDVAAPRGRAGSARREPGLIASGAGVTCPVEMTARVIGSVATACLAALPPDARRVTLASDAGVRRRRLRRRASEPPRGRRRRRSAHVPTAALKAADQRARATRNSDRDGQQELQRSAFMAL